MKQLYFSIITLLFCSALLHSQTTVDFNTSTDLTDSFNPSPGAIFTNGSSGGISDTGAVDLSTSTENWTSKMGVPVVTLETYKVSVFVKLEGAPGRGGIGFTITDVNTTNLYGHPLKTLGFSMYGSGCDFINNSSDTNISWGTNYLTQGSWYYMELSIKNTAVGIFDIDFDIYNADANGVIGSLHENESFTSITNTDVGSINQPSLYPYFCHSRDRLSKLDDFTYSSASTLSVGTESFVNSVMMYPNPTQDFLQISGLQSDEPYEIYNTLGAQVVKGMVSNGKKIEIQNLTNGMYFLKLESGRTFKFLKE